MATILLLCCILFSTPQHSLRKGGREGGGVTGYVLEHTHIHTYMHTEYSLLGSCELTERSVHYLLKLQTSLHFSALIAQPAKGGGGGGGNG